MGIVWPASERGPDTGRQIMNHARGGQRIDSREICLRAGQAQEGLSGPDDTGADSGVRCRSTSIFILPAGLSSLIS